ncbi:hypothetical protein BH24DEI2_BH24DEI2_16120 [soil metagenome]
MTNVDVSKLSLKGVEQLTEHCEHLIHNHKADLGDYALYIQCQTELVKRTTDKPMFVQGLVPQFINS